MSYLKHKVYGLLFKLFRCTKVDENIVSFVVDSNHSFKANLDFIKREFEKRGDYSFHYFYKDRLSFKNFKILASSKFIFLNDNFFPFAFMDFNPETIIIQLWHAPGAFKKFGGSVDFKSRGLLKKISDKTDYLIVTSDNIKEFYTEAFQMPKSKIKALGLPRIDYYFEGHDVAKLKADFCERYGISSDLKIILYAPTFRQEDKFNNVFDYLDLNHFNEVLGDEYVLALRFHPKIKEFFDDVEVGLGGGYVDVSDFESEQMLMLISDLLITDYSSIMIEYSILDKPIIFFVYDYDYYLKDDRGFYFDFESTVPGPIVFTCGELVKVIGDACFDKSKLSGFVHSQFNEIDGQSSARIVDFVLSIGGGHE